MTDNTRAFHAMVLKGMELNQPKHYTDDLHVHDRVNLGLGRIPEYMPNFTVPEGAPFAWIVRDCGTELIYIGTPTGHVDDPSLINMATLAYYERGGFGHDNVTCWWWDGLGPGLVEIKLSEVKCKLYEAFYKYERKAGGRRVHSLPMPPSYDSFGQLIRPLAS